MCLAIPAKIVSVNREDNSACVDLAGVHKVISLALVSDITVNDYVLVHVGFALNKISEHEAERTLELFAQAGVITQEDER